MQNQKIVLRYNLIRTTKRLTFDITYMDPQVRYFRKDDGPYLRFEASNGVEVFSRSRMDIHTERIWLLGGSIEERSGSMPFSSNEKRDKMYVKFIDALNEWAHQVGGIAIKEDVDD